MAEHQQAEGGIVSSDVVFREHHQKPDLPPSEYVEEDDAHAAMHFLQQAQANAAFLPGGEHFGSIVDEFMPTVEEAADSVRADIASAIAALEEASK